MTISFFLFNREYPLMDHSHYFVGMASYSFSMNSLGYITYLLCMLLVLL